MRYFHSNDDTFPLYLIGAGDKNEKKMPKEEKEEEEKWVNLKVSIFSNEGTTCSVTLQ